MKKEESLDKKIEYASNDRWGHHVCKVKDIKEKIQNVQRRIKNFVKNNPFFYSTHPSLKLFREIDKIFKEEIGEGLLK